MFILFGCINNTLILIICQVEIEKFFNLKQKNLEMLHENVIPRSIYAIYLWGNMSIQSVKISRANSFPLAQFNDSMTFLGYISIVGHNNNCFPLAIHL